MRKNIRSRRIDYEVLNILNKKEVSLNLKANVKAGLIAVQDYLKFRKKPKIYFSDEERENLAEYWGTISKRPIIILFTKSIEDCDDSREITRKTIIHEYLHYFFDKKKLSKIFDVENEELIIERIEEDIWKKYFI